MISARSSSATCWGFSRSRPRSDRPSANRPQLLPPEPSALVGRSATFSRCTCSRRSCGRIASLGSGGPDRLAWSAGASQLECARRRGRGSPRGTRVGRGWRRRGRALHAGRRGCARRGAGRDRVLRSTPDRDERSRGHVSPASTSVARPLRSPRVCREWATVADLGDEKPMCPAGLELGEVRDAATRSPGSGGRRPGRRWRDRRIGQRGGDLGKAVVGVPMKAALVPLRR